ncbi:hypothetical protein TWF694_005144 [Orbilia ellipsospora]|uniref:F-box domain-containing protein n=1 Tax=Orbilia ellipsospora TaxID=2528407 RepID=A0AAV9WV07_9PEZI
MSSYQRDQFHPFFIPRRIPETPPDSQEARAVETIETPKSSVKKYLSKIFKQKSKIPPSLPGPEASQRHQGADRTDFDMGQHLRLKASKATDTTPRLTSSIKRQIKSIGSVLRNFIQFVRPHPPPSSVAFNTPRLKKFLNRFSGPINRLPTPLLIKIFQQVPPEDLTSLLSVNRKCRSTLLDNYHVILSYPHVITTKYEMCPLRFTFPIDWTDHLSAQFYNILHRVVMYEDCFQITAEVLADGYIKFWKAAAERNPRLKANLGDLIDCMDWEDLKDDILARLVRNVWKRRVLTADEAVKFTLSLAPLGYLHVALGGCDNIKGKWATGIPHAAIGSSRASLSDDSNESLDLESNIEPILMGKNLLRQAIKYTIHPNIREELSYSYPSVKLERLHPVQILEFMRIKTPSWNWRQEDRVEKLRKQFVGSPAALEEMEKCRDGWEIMRVRIEGVVNTFPF